MRVYLPGAVPLEVDAAPGLLPIPEARGFGAVAPADFTRRRLRQRRDRRERAAGTGSGRRRGLGDWLLFL